MKKRFFFLVTFSIFFISWTSLFSNEWNPNFDCKGCPKQGPPGLQGSAGPAGAEGAQGPEGLSGAVFGGFYLTPDGGSVAVPFGDPIPFNQTSGSNATSLVDGNTILIDSPGNYLVTYGVSNDNFGGVKLTLNDVDLPGSFTSWAFLTATNQFQVVSVIINVEFPFSSLQLINVTTVFGGERTLTVSTARPSSPLDAAAYLTILRLGPSVI